MTLTAILEGVELVSMASARRSIEDEDTSGSLPLLSDSFSQEVSIKKKNVDPSNTIFFFYKLLLIKGCIAFSQDESVGEKNTDTLKTLILKDIQIHYLYTCTYITQMEFNMVKVIHIDHNPECLLSRNRNFKIDLCMTIFSHKENILICPG